MGRRDSDQTVKGNSRFSVLQRRLICAEMPLETRYLDERGRVMVTKEDLLPWQWEDATWRAIVDKARAGRSLKPKVWQGGAKVAVA